MKPIVGRKILGALVLALITVTPCFGGVFFESSWNLATGNTDVALSDGFRWSGGVQGTNLLNVTTGGPGGNNVLTVDLNDQQFGHVWVGNLPIEQYSDMYYRFYVKVYPATNISYPSFHGIENFDQSQSWNFYFIVRNANASTWTPAIATYAGQTEGFDKEYRCSALSTGQWYRVESHIHWFGHTSGSPTTWTMQIYDSNNNRVRDESGFYPAYVAGPTLKEMYAAGKRYYLGAKTNTWAMGNNGPAGGTGQGRIYDLSCFSLGNDPSALGPVTTKMALDNIAPQAINFFPKDGATGVSAKTMISLNLREAGFGIDTASIGLKINGVSVKPNHSGSLWNQTVIVPASLGYPAGTKIAVEVTAQDKATPPNVMLPAKFSFTIAGTPGIHPVSMVARSMRSVEERVVFNLLGQKVRPAMSLTKTNMVPRIIIDEQGIRRTVD